jgi:hypothetical protein
MSNVLMIWQGTAYRRLAPNGFRGSIVDNVLTSNANTVCNGLSVAYAFRILGTNIIRRELANAESSIDGIKEALCSPLGLHSV